MINIIKSKIGFDVEKHIIMIALEDFVISTSTKYSEGTNS